MPGDLTIPVTAIPGVGRGRAVELNKLGLNTVEDVLFHLPRRYEDMSRLVPLGEVRPGDKATVRGRLLAIKEARARSRRGLMITKAVIGDDTGRLNLLWFGAGTRTPSPLLRKLREVGEVVVHGEALEESGLLLMKNPEWDVAERDSLHIGRIVPIYPGTDGLPAKVLRRVIHQAVEVFAQDIADFLPGAGASTGPATLGWALREVHAPASLDDVQRARRRLALEEAFLLQLALERRRQWRVRDADGIPLTAGSGLADEFARRLPFRLTGAQRRAVREVHADMAAARPMERLLLGDVGSGKTVVAALALLRAVENGYQGAMMAPTEILAEQHHGTLTRMCRDLPVRVGLLTGASREKEGLLNKIREGHVDIVVGTQALIQGEATFAALGLVVVDEQHRFGVNQRSLLARKGQAPDTLVMSATPIPRTLALSVYGDLDVSILDDLPPGRQPIVTRWVKESARRRVYEFVRKKLGEGRQAYLVCPFVEDSETLTGRSAVAEAGRLANSEFAGYPVGLLHGQLGSEEKERVMRRFRDGECRLLVTTTVVEVGVDVPNATVMIIENAERFGLAQLHQLRGRVGRSDLTSYCILLGEAVGEEAVRRLSAMVRISDGFRLAEEDLALRGPGEFFGTRQSGLPELRLPFGEVLGDARLVRDAKDLATTLLAGDPCLASPVNTELKRHLERRFGPLLAGLS